MTLSTQKKFALPLSSSNFAAGLTHDVTWDRPLFRPPSLPNPRVMFDPLPFTANRIGAGRREDSKS
ncbi:MAG: hypothetical protein ABI273_17810 [Lacunisphaera sp.]